MGMDAQQKAASIKPWPFPEKLLDYPNLPPLEKFVPLKPTPPQDVEDALL